MSKSKTKEAAPILAELGAVEITAAEGEGKAAHFDTVAYTGGALSVPRYDLPVVVDLAGLSFRNNVVANLDHDPTKRVGVVTAKVNDGQQLVLSGTASAATPHRDEVVNSARDGFTWQASIEAMPKKVDLLRAGQKATVNGQQFTGPLYVARESVLKGFAFVSHGADDSTAVTIAASDQGQQMELKKEIKAWVEGLGLDVESLTETQIENITADWEGRQQPQKKEPAKPIIQGSSDLDRELARREAEEERERRISEIALDRSARFRNRTKEIRALAGEAIEAGWPVDRFRLEIAEALISEPTDPFSGKVKDREVLAGTLEAAIAISGNLPKLEAHYPAQTLERASQNFPHGVGLQEIILVAAQANGYQRPMGSQVTVEAQRYAFGMAPIHASGFSTFSLPGILSNSANKFLLEGWGSGDMAWSQIASRKRVRDFKTATSYRLHGNLTYEKVGPDGELPHGTVGETSYTNKAETYGRMFAVTRTDIVNDDLDAITQVPFELGVGAIDKLNNVFWTEFLDNTTFFASGNNNVSTGAGSALALAGLSAAEVVFYAQTKPNGEPLSVMPKILLVPPTLKATALQLMNSSLVVHAGAAANATSTIGNANVWQGRFDVVTSPYMENSAYTGYSTAAWYLLADPMRMSTIEVAFLNGREAPIVETADAEFNVLGFQMRGYHDFGVSKQEYRAGVRSAGS